MLSPSMFGFSGENVITSTVLGIVKKQLPSSKSKKKAKHMFCIVNDVHDCCQARAKGMLEDDDDGLTPESDTVADTLDVHFHHDSLSGPTLIAEKNTEGLSDLLSYNTHKVRDFVGKMESRIRLGDCDARWKMQKILPLQCFSRNYPRIFNVLRQNSSSCQQTTYIHIHMLPEITILLHQCMMPTKQYEDDLIILIRSCIPFFQNPRRVKHDHAWPEQNDQNLCMLLKWCMPSMLSLYPQVCVKDVNFDVRVGIVRLFRELLVGSFEDRNTFYLQHKTLIKMCLMEYIYYVIQNINILPQTQYMKSINVNVMATNVFNIGQQFRVELNLEFAKTDKNTSTTAILRLLNDLQPKCHVMFERCCRYNKNSLHCSYSEMYSSSQTLTSASIRTKRTIDDANPLNLDVLSQIPYTRFFSVFEMYCRRSNITSTHINTLWDHMQLIQVYEVSVDLIQQQTKALRASWDCNKIQIHRQSTLLVCMLCAQKNVFPTFRHDVRNNRYTCNRCNISNCVFEIDLIGRIAVVCNVPLVFSLCCQKIVILTGRGTEFSLPAANAIDSVGQQARQMVQSKKSSSCSTNTKSSAVCSCIAWDKHTTTLNFSQVLGSISISQHIAQYEPPVFRRWDTASREYMQLRIAGNTSTIMISQHARNMCCMCRINAVQNKYTLLDIYNSCMVIVCVCSKHSMPAHLCPTVLTVSDYIETILLRSHRT